MRLLRADRIEKTKQANVLTVTADGQVFIRDTDKAAVWTAMHLSQTTRINGKPVKPTAIESMAWQVFNGSRSSAKMPLLPEIAQSPIDLLTALDSVQRCLIVGASDSGKTTLLQHLISRKLSSSSVIMIDPHAYPDKFPTGCKVIGLGRDYAEIDKALAALVQIMTKRYDEIGQGVVAEMGHNRVTILIDEWRAITANVGKPASEAIKALLTESRKAAFSVFVATHSDRAKPLGLEGEYDLKDGFAIVKLSIINGVRQATFNTGDGERIANLPGLYQNVTNQIIDTSIKPTSNEELILKLHSKDMSYNAIARQVYGNVGGKQTKQIKEIIAKFS